MSRESHDLLLRRCFSTELQNSFAQLSGDFNPMHVDAVVARRTMAGGQVVHGIHQVLFAMEAVLSRVQQRSLPARTIAGFTAVFHRPILVGETVDFRFIESTSEICRVAVEVRGDADCLITIRWGDLPSLPPSGPPPLRPEPVAELLFDEMTGKTGVLEIGLDAALAREMFPLAMATLGPLGIAEVLALSRLVGMHCPGLHSLFGKCAVNFREPVDSCHLRYEVIDADARFGKLVMQVNGGLIEGQVAAFCRPPPERQPGMAEVRRRVKPGSFAESVALIVGGSRGLGEVTARLIAAGGGVSIITYHRGEADAGRIADEIRSAGGRSHVLPFDIGQVDAFLDLLSQKKVAPRSLYYYATPKIFGRRRGLFDYDLLGEFQEAYVAAFGRLVDGLAPRSSTPLRVFYPSSIAVAETARELAEYAMAKRSGEELCEFYNRHMKQVEIIVERLPRIHTDQTSTLLPIPAENALEVMLPLVRRVELRQPIG